MQIELNEFVLARNSRNVRQFSAAPGGTPNISFSLPPNDFKNCGFVLQEGDVTITFETLGIQKLTVAKNNDLNDLLCCYFELRSLSIAIDLETSLNLYVKLLDYLKTNGFSM